LCISVIRCPALDTTYAELSSTDTEFGVSVNISCLPGYRISGQTTATVHCTGTGHWSLNNATCLRTLHLTVYLNTTIKQLYFLDAVIAMVILPPSLSYRSFDDPAGQVINSTLSSRTECTVDYLTVLTCTLDSLWVHG